MSDDAQRLPVAVDLGMAENLSGQRFGTLVAIERVIGDAAKTQWLLECDCGRFALREATYLLRAKKHGHESCCNVCLRELNGGRFVALNDYHQSLYRMIYDVTGSLYGADYDEQFVSACLEETGLDLQESPPSAAELATVAGEPPHEAGHGAMLFPISGANGWPCAHCNKPFTEGFWCIDCIDPVCSECTADHSAQRSSFAMTLEAVALNFEVSRERIRQVEAKALRKLRHPSRAKFFKEYTDPDYLKISEPMIETTRDIKHCGVMLQRVGDVVYCPRCGTTKDRICNTTFIALDSSQSSKVKP